MKTSFPGDIGFSGMYLNGYRREPPTGSEQLVGTVVVKRNYQISGNQLVPQTDPFGIRLTDELKLPGQATQIELPGPKEGCEGCLSRYEHDIAVYKPLADLVVIDDYLLSHNYQVSVQGEGGSSQLWFNRTINSPQPPPPDLDAAEHIFGWLPRGGSVREGEGNLQITLPDDDTAIDVPNMRDFNNQFFNGSRRDFTPTYPPFTGFPQDQFQAGDSISMTRTRLVDAQSDIIFDFVLGQENIYANVYLYSGRGPDKERYWCVERPIDFRLDTLVVTPSQDNAYVVWRGVWDHAQFPANNYRKLDVIAQGVSNG
jgi:hypothetical protein